MLYPFIKYFINSFVDISVTLSDNSFSSFSMATCFVLLELTFLLIFINFSWKSVVFTRSAISPLVANLACFNLAVKLTAVNLWNSWVVIYLSQSGICFSISSIFVL